MKKTGYSVPHAKDGHTKVAQIKQTLSSTIVIYVLPIETTFDSNWKLFCLDIKNF